MDQKSLLSDKPEIILDKYYRKLLDNNINVEQMYLFGSYAKGEAKPWSDLDVCVVSSDFKNNLFEIGTRLQQFNTNIEALIEPHALHPNDFKDKRNLLVAEVKKYGKLIPRPII